MAITSSSDKQRMIGRRRFLNKNIERRSGHDARSDCVVQRLFINQPTARAIYYAHALLHFSEGLLANDATRFGS